HSWEVAVEDFARLVGEFALREGAFVGVDERKTNEAHVWPVVRARHGAPRVVWRTDVGEHELDVALRQLFSEPFPHRWNLVRGLLERDSGCETHVDALHGFVDLGEEGAR